MKCGDEEWQHCQVEKMGCEGCYYDVDIIGKRVKVKHLEFDGITGTIIDEVLNNPEVMMVQAGKIIKEAKEEAEKVVNKNKKLEEALIEKDKEIAYLKGKVDTMQDVIKELNAPIEITQEK